MPNIQLHRQLLEMPLFQGMSNNDLADIVGHTRFGFTKYARGKTVVTEQQPCTHLYLLLGGTLAAERYADDRSYSVSEQIDAPAILQPEHIFGLNQHHTATFTALTPCSFIRLDKSEILRLAEHYEIFRLNLLNIVTTQTQRQTRRPWQTRPKETRERVVRFFENHCLRPAGPKRFRIKMEVLARETGDSRLNVSKQLHDMQEEKLLTFSRGIINIPALERILMRG